MKKYLREIEIAGIILAVIGIVSALVWGAPFGLSAYHTLTYRQALPDGLKTSPSACCRLTAGTLACDMHGAKGAPRPYHKLIKGTSHLNMALITAL